jgi:transcriptional regulator with XRE-family HTH domain
MENRFDIGDFVNVLTVEKTQCDLVNRVRERRKEMGLTQRELAKRSFVSYASIRRFETTGDISFRSLLEIGRVLNCLNDFYELFSKEIILDIRSKYED